MPIPCPHFKITIVKRSQGQSAVAGAAYQSGERLFSEYDQKTKFYNKKKELVHAEIMLPSHAPPGYADRQNLWNAVEAVENQWNSQLARRIVLAFPVEVPKKQYLKMIRDFCQEQFVSKGMIADFAIHDKGDGNPHAHILLTLRAMDEHGKWLPKARKVYDLDENGERIRLPSGNWKCHKENTVDWNDQKYAEVWRHSWETITNRYLEAAGRPERVDLRSFERQGIQQIPTVHLGPAAHQIEKRGVETFLGNLNRDIRAANSLMQSIRSAIRGLQRWIADLNAKKQLLLDALEKAKEPINVLDSLPQRFNCIRIFQLPIGVIEITVFLIHSIIGSKILVNDGLEANCIFVICFFYNVISTVQQTVGFSRFSAKVHFGTLLTNFWNRQFTQFCTDVFNQQSFYQPLYQHLIYCEESITLHKIIGPVPCKSLIDIQPLGHINKQISAGKCTLPS